MTKTNNMDQSIEITFQYFFYAFSLIEILRNLPKISSSPLPLRAGAITRILYVTYVYKAFFFMYSWDEGELLFKRRARPRQRRIRVLTPKDNHRKDENVETQGKYMVNSFPQPIGLAVLANKRAKSNLKKSIKNTCITLICTYKLKTRIFSCNAMICILLIENRLLNELLLRRKKSVGWYNEKLLMSNIEYPIHYIFFSCTPGRRTCTPSLMSGWGWYIVSRTRRLRSGRQTYKMSKFKIILDRIRVYSQKRI